jgi:hypothetical protein
VNQVLNVIFVLNNNTSPIAVPDSQLLGDFMESGAYVQSRVQPDIRTVRVRSWRSRCGCLVFFYVKSVLAMYVPPDPQKMQYAYEAGNVSLNPASSVMNLVFTNYAQPGDKMTLTFDTAAKKITALNVDTYMGEAKDKVTLQVQMGSLPDGTNYAQQTVLNAAAKELTVTTINSNYQKL